MNYLEKIDAIIVKLENNNENELAKSIVELKTNSFIQSEILMSVTHNLKTASMNNIKLYDLINEDVDDLLNFCNSIGLKVK